MGKIAERIKVYQICDNDQRLSSHKKFISDGTIDPSSYTQVFNAEVFDDNDAIRLEDLFYMFNDDEDCHPLYRGTHMSVGDIIVNDDGAFYCNEVGFTKVNFDETKTVKQNNLFRVVYVEPHRPAYESWVENSLEGEQKAVSGLIELIYNDDGTIIVCNDEAKLIGMEGNRHLDNGVSIIAGSFFIVGDDGEDFRSLTDEEVDRYVKKYSKPEEISVEDTIADMGVYFYEF